MRQPRNKEKFIQDNIHEILQCCDGTRHLSSAKESIPRRKLKDAFYFFLAPSNGFAGAKKKNLKAEMDKMDIAIMNWLTRNVSKDYCKYEEIPELEYPDAYDKNSEATEVISICHCDHPCRPGDFLDCVLAAGFYECRSCKPDCGNKESDMFPMKMENLLEVKFVSKEKGFGLFTKQEIHKFAVLGEVTGVVIDKGTVDRKTKENTNKYLFEFYGNDNINAHSIDTQKKGNYARFINHSHDPNAICELWNSRKGWILKIRAIEELKKGDEVTIDYGWNDEKIACFCGANNCPKTFASTVEQSKYPHNSQSVIQRKKKYF